MLHLDILNSICQVVAILDSWFKSCYNVVWSSGVFMVYIYITSSLWLPRCGTDNFCGTITKDPDKVQHVFSIKSTMIEDLYEGYIL